MKFELYIQGHDRPDHDDHKTVKMGDIVAARPYPWNWGLMEIKHGLIVLVDVPWSLNPMPDLSSVTKIQVAQFLRKTGTWFRLKIAPRETIDEVFARLNVLPIAQARALVVQAWREHERDRVDMIFQSRLHDRGIHETQILDPDPDDPDLSTAKLLYSDPVVCTHPDLTGATALGGKVWRNRPTILGKRKFRLPVQRLLALSNNNIDLDKVKDPAYIYQPFKAASQLVSKFTGGKNRTLAIKDVDCAASGAIDAEQEVSFNWRKLTEPIPQDKWDDADLNPAEAPPPDLSDE